MNNFTNMKYIAYCRKSSESEDRQALSIESQEKELLRLAEKENIKIVKILKESKSAKNPGRPVFNEMVKIINSGQADGILCWKLDRLARNPVDGGSISWMLQQNIIKNIKTIEKDYFPSDNVLLMSFEFGMANQYIRDLSVNVKRGLKTKLENGGYSGQAPVGYLNDKANKTIIVDSIKSKFIVRIFELFSTGSYSLNSLRELLHKEGMRTKTGNKISKSLIHKILSSTFYYGITVSHGKYYKGNHTPLISKDLFDKAQNVLTGNSRPKPQKHFFTYRGFVRCDHCGCLFTATKKKGHDYYYCTNGKNICNEHRKYLRSEKLTDLIAPIFDKLKFDNELIEIMYLASKEKIKSDKNYMESSTETTLKLLNAVKDKQNRLLDSFISNLVSKEAYEPKMQELKNEQIELESQLDQNSINNQDPYITLEQIKKVFLLANQSKKDFLEADDLRKRKKLEILLWNLKINNQNVAEIAFKMPYQRMAETPKNATFETMLRDLDSPRD